MQGTWNNKKVVLPDFIIPGAAKSGTTTLYRILQQHPDIFVPNRSKETYFFSYFDRDLPYEKEFVSQAVLNPIEYLSLFEKGRSASTIGEASIGYLYDHEACIKNMKRFYGDKLSNVKIVMILRNPVDRAFSHYNFLIRNGFEDLSFEMAISEKVVLKRKNIRPGFDYLNYGMYYEKVKAFKENFSECKVFLFEDLANYSKLTEELFSFLKVKRHSVQKDIKANPSGVPKSEWIVRLLRKNSFLKALYRMFPEKMQNKMLTTRDNLMSSFLKKTKLSEELRERVKPLFAEDIQKLEILIERDLSHWK
ncbi:MAG: hypothetical protein HKN39_04950 [Flavobacteriales bacterium]|nr:hypothetical protein [Flavobacteriales bacterium]